MTAIAFALAVVAASFAIIVVASLRFVRAMQAPQIEGNAAKWIKHAEKLEALAMEAERRGHDGTAGSHMRNARAARERARS